MIKKTSAQQSEARSVSVWLTWLMWGIAVGMIAMVAIIMVQRVTGVSAQPEDVVVEATSAPVVDLAPHGSSDAAPLPSFEEDQNLDAVVRTANLHTIIPSQYRKGVVEYTVSKGDSVFSIAGKYNLKPETVLWANYGLLDDNPNMLSIGQDLIIPPVDGVYYQWKEGDTIQKVADEYLADAQDILLYPGNNLDLTNPQVEPGTYIMIPGGWRENRQWIIPTIWAANSGANKSIPGGCEVPAGGAVGSGSFVWPTVTNYLSGNDYWSGHLGIDIAALTGDPIYAADSGVVVYAAPISGGYGNMVMIDHGNGYHTVYAHLSAFNVYCGQSVARGQLIAYAGSTGNSTGPHLHFEVRYNGGFINPWYVLP